VFDIARWRARWPWLDAILTVTDRFGAVGGGPLSSSIALATFVSLFPLLLVIIAVVGFVASADTSFAVDLVRDLGLRGRAADVVRNALATAEGSRRAASVVGLVGLLWSGLGVVGSLQAALNAAWQVQGRGLVDKLVALRWLVGAGSLFLLTAALGPMLGVLPGPVKPLAVILGIALTALLFVWTYTSLGNVNVGWRAHLPGALLVAVGFEVLKAVGSLYVPRAVASASALYGTLGVVFAVLAWLLLYGRLIMYGAVLNVLRYEDKEGTVTAQIEVPRIDGEVPLTTTRGGAVDEHATAVSPARDD
jgi:membrane protein